MLWNVLKLLVVIQLKYKKKQEGDQLLDTKFTIWDKQQQQFLSRLYF